MGVTAANIAALGLLDNFNRKAENPMKQAIWTVLPWAKNTGQVLNERWTAGAFTEEKSGAYWNVGKLPAQAVRTGPIWAQESAGNLMAVWACLQIPAQSGYKLSIEQLTEHSKYQWQLFKVVAGVETKLASGKLEGFPTGTPVNTELELALAVVEGKVTVWTKRGAAEWVKAVEEADATFTEGYIGMEAKWGELILTDAVYGGELVEEIKPEPEPEPTPEPEPKPEPEPEIEAEAPAPGSELLLDIEPSPGLATVLGPFYVGGFRDHPDFLPLGLSVTQAINLRLKMVSGKGVYRVVLRWHHKRELTAPYVEDELFLAEESALLDQQFPLRGPWLTVELERRQSVHTAKFKAILQPVGAAASQSRLGSQTLLSAPAVGVGKESSVQKVMSRTAPGPASLVVAGSGEGASRTLLLERLTSTGAWTRFLLLALPNLVTPAAVPLVLPATPIRATIANGTAAEITADLLIGAT